MTALPLRSTPTQKSLIFGATPNRIHKILRVARTTMQGTKKERFLYYNSLVCLAKALEGYYTIVDLRNEAYLSGKIESVDGYMNIEMSDVTFYNPRGKEYAFETFFVVSRNVRYIHIPDNCNAMQLMQNELCSKNERKPARDAKRTFKQKRAEKYHQETLQAISKSKT